MSGNYKICQACKRKFHVKAGDICPLCKTPQSQQPPRLTTCPDCGHTISLSAQHCPSCGNVFVNPAPVPTPKQKQVSIKNIFILLVLSCGLAVFFVEIPADEKTSAQSTSDQSHMATVHCQNLMESLLTSPASAKHPWHKTNRSAGQNYAMRSYVDSQNAFGALIRTHYLCDLDYLGGQSADIRNWKINTLQPLP